MILKILSAFSNVFSILSFWKKDDNNNAPSQKTTNKLNNKGNNNTIYQDSTINNHFGDNYNTQENAPYIVDEVSRMPYLFRGRQVSENWFLLILLSSIVITVLLFIALNKAITDNYPTKVWLVILITILVFFTISSYLYNLSTRINKARLFSSFTGHLVANHDGKLYKVKYKGKCNYCGGKIYVRVINGVPKAQCQIHKEIHLFDFTPRIFDVDRYA